MDIFFWTADTAVAQQPNQTKSISGSTKVPQRNMETTAEYTIAKACIEPESRMQRVLKAGNQLCTYLLNEMEDIENSDAVINIARYITDYQQRIIEILGETL